jgi:hypothetical protein
MFGSPQIEVAAAIVVPLLVFILNWGVRSQYGYALSAAADFALALAAFDLVALLYASVFAEVMRNEVFRESFNRMEIILFALTVIVWLWPLLRLEHQMTHQHHAKNRHA